MCSLPPERLKAHFRPFTYTGIDYFGPLEIVIGRRTEKRWGVILTCMTIRAVHIELASSLSTDSCILVLRNFIARRGQPLKMMSDNGTNFVGTNNELQRELEKLKYDDLQSSFSEIKWQFITPGAPHMGGAWERLVRSIKANLFRTLPTKRPSEELLRSTLIEIERIINSRPLTYVPIDNETDEALTPNHFLVGTSDGSPLPGEFDDKDLDLRKAWKISQRIADKFWSRWIVEYLPTLTRRTKWFQPQPPIKIGDVVIIVDERQRCSWTKGMVIDTVKGKDGQVRTVVVKTAKGIYTRPAVKVAVLDVVQREQVQQNFPTPDESHTYGVNNESSPNTELVNAVSRERGGEC